MTGPAPSPASGPNRAPRGRAGGRRDRRGRGVRGPLAWPPVPAMQSRAGLFDELVLDAAARLEGRAGKAFADIEFAVEDVPPSDPASWESADIALGRLFPAEASMPPRIVVYRRPVETRAHDRRELAALVNDVVVEQVAALLGVDPHELDPGYEPDEE